MSKAVSGFKSLAKSVTVVDCLFLYQKGTNFSNLKHEKSRKSLKKLNKSSDEI